MSPNNKRKNKKKSKMPDDPRSTKIPHRSREDKLMMRFYEPLVLQWALGETRGPHIVCEPLESSDVSELDNGGLRRLFVRSLAYLCDYEKGGATITAVALEKTPAGVVFWVAANELNEQKVDPFLRKTLEKLAGLDSPGSVAVAEDMIFVDAVEFGKKRLEKYWQSLLDPLEKFLNVLGKSEQDGDLTELLKGLKQYRDDTLGLCRFAYEKRRSSSMKELVRRSQRDPDTEDSNAGRCRAIRHYIGRLAWHMKAAKTLVAMAERFPMLFVDFRIEYCRSPKREETPPAMDARTTLNGIATRMLPSNSDPNYVKSIKDSLNFMNTKFRIEKRVQDKYKDTRFMPRVHAELILLEHLYMKNCEFDSGDKYIGCSKPACYCCYYYIDAHPGGFVRPGSHNKTYLNWRPPYIPEDDPTGSAKKRQEDILNNMLKKIRLDVLTQIEERSPRRDAHRDSTTGISRSDIAEPSNLMSGLELDDDDTSPYPSAPNAVGSPQDSDSSVIGEGSFSGEEADVLGLRPNHTDSLKPKPTPQHPSAPQATGWECGYRDPSPGGSVYFPAEVGSRGVGGGRGVGRV